VYSKVKEHQELMWWVILTFWYISITPGTSHLVASDHYAGLARTSGVAAYHGFSGSMEPGTGARESPARYRQYFSYPYILFSLGLLQMHVPIKMFA
jgi:hypothetical protein